jgi:Flp pilus assembly protein TadG
MRITTFLGRLRRDVRGNTLAIMAAAMIPLIAMIGSGIDTTRAYMAQNRFRQACDAGALAGRKLLVGTTVSDAVRNEATKYFRFNFPLGHFQSAAYTLGSGLIGHSQKMTVAASATAEKKTVGQRS